MATLEDAIIVAAKAHNGQKDKSGLAYIFHPLRMMLQMKSESEMIAAILHDVVEDGGEEWNLENLRRLGFSEEILKAVDCLTYREGESYEEFIDRVKTNHIARQVKIADLEDNMNVQRINKINSKDLKRLEKYHNAWRYLTTFQLNIEDFKN